jgi:predicted RNase H-like HicB family nuclease
MIYKNDRFKLDKLEKKWIKVTKEEHKDTIKNRVDNYLKLPYNVIIKHIIEEDNDYYLAQVLEFDGCMSDGATYQEAFENIQIAMAGWIETKLKNDFKVPLPISYYSEKFCSLYSKLSNKIKP